jgi:hypothetical protein
MCLFGFRGACGHHSPNRPPFVCSANLTEARDHVRRQGVAKVFFDAIKEFFPLALALDKYPASPVAKEALTPSMYAVRANKISYSIENAVSRTARLCLSGSREIYAAPGWAVAEFLKESSADRRMPELKDRFGEKSLSKAGWGSVQGGEGHHRHVALMGLLAELLFGWVLLSCNVAVTGWWAVMSDPSLAQAPFPETRTLRSG